MYRVLYIEDEPDAVEDMPVLLKERGLDVIAEESIGDALVLFEREHFDAVLLDVCMPPTADMPFAVVGYGRETGLEVARRLRKLKDKVPIVALTVVNDAEIQGRMREAGICRIINKPSEAARIAEDVLNVITRDRERR